MAATQSAHPLIEELRVTHVKSEYTPQSPKLIIIVSQGCHTTYHKLSGLKQVKTKFFLIILGISPKSNCQQNNILAETLAPPQLLVAPDNPWCSLVCSQSLQCLTPTLYGLSYISWCPLHFLRIPVIGFRVLNVKMISLQDPQLLIFTKILFPKRQHYEVPGRHKLDWAAVFNLLQ